MAKSHIQISLAAARVNAGMNQAEVSEKLNVTRATIVNWEKGRSEPTISQARSLSDLYGIPLDYIFLPSESN